MELSARNGTLKPQQDAHAGPLLTGAQSQAKSQICEISTPQSDASPKLCLICLKCGTHSEVLPARVAVQALSDVIAQAFSEIVHELGSLQRGQREQFKQHPAPGDRWVQGRPLTGVMQLLSNLSFTSSGGRKPPAATPTESPGKSRWTIANISAQKKNPRQLPLE